MALRTGYISRQAAREADSVFEPERFVKRIYKDGEPLWELAQREKSNGLKLEQAEQSVEISRIQEEEIEEIKDIESLINSTFNVIRDSMLLIHTQLAELKRLVAQDEDLKNSGFPIEVADQLEDMLIDEISRIVSHLRQMATELQRDSTDAEMTRDKQDG